MVFLIAVTVALGASFLCSICEAVLLSINHAQIEALTQKHPMAGRLLSGFKRNVDVPLVAILIVNTSALTVGASLAGATFGHVFDRRDLWIFILVFTLCTLLFSHIIPRALGASHARLFAAPAAFCIRTFTFVLKPLVVASGFISRMLRSRKEEPASAAEQFRLLTAPGRNDGIVGGPTAGMIEGTTLLKKMRALDVMIPRQKVTFLSGKDSREETRLKLTDTEFSRFPFSPTPRLDDVSGVVLSRKLLFWMHDHPNEEVDWPSVTGDALIVPDSMRLDALLKTFQSERRHLAIVVDEFGSVEGIATLEDVIEEVIGEIDDETDEPIPGLSRQPDGSLQVRGGTDLRRVCFALGLAWSPELEVTTMAGLISERLGRIPVPGDVVGWRGYRLEVLVADERRARQIRISPAADDEPDVVSANDRD